LTVLAVGVCACFAGNWKETGAAPFCIDTEDGDLYQIGGVSDGSANGTVVGQLLTDASSDLFDFDYIGYVAYAMKNTKTGGAQTTGLSDNNGSLQAVLGEGSWSFTAGTVVRGNTCTATMNFEVEGGRQTTICPLVTCEE
jgi:hypothetical protein